MKRLTWILVLLVFLCCKKSDDPDEIRLQRTESTDYTGDVLHTGYSYDNQDRVTSIMQNKNNEQPAVAVTISYIGNEVVLLSSPDMDPIFTGKILKCG